jgi:Flp pilus assembly protein TadD
MVGVCSPVVSSRAATPLANSVPSQALASAELKKLLDDAERGITRGDFGVALIQLKNAGRSAPRDGEIRAYLGSALPKSGDTRTPERESRDARKDRAPEEMVIPPLLDAMVVRGEANANELLEQFPDPGPRMILFVGFR